MFNIKNQSSIEQNYQNGLLPQRNSKELFYQSDDFSCRSSLTNFTFSSENKRIFKKTNDFSFEKIKLSDFQYDPSLQKTLTTWVKKLGWNFPASSIKTVFTNHIFNYLYICRNQSGQTCAYSICLFHKNFSHIAYVFYDPSFAHQDLPIRLSLEVVKDSQQQNLEFCYLGRFNPSTKLGYYKRNFPGFQYFAHGQWLSYN